MIKIIRKEEKPEDILKNVKKKKDKLIKGEEVIKREKENDEKVVNIKNENKRIRKIKK